MPKATFYRRKVDVAIQPNIGLDAAARQSVVGILNLLLADEAVLSFKTRGADGDAPETNDPGLQTLYDAQCKQIHDIVMEIAERVAILGGTHIKEPAQLIASARLDGRLPVVPGVIGILADHEALIRFLREDAQKCVEAYEDQGTFALLVNVIRLHEKMAWKLRSHIENESVQDESKGNNMDPGGAGR